MKPTENINLDKLYTDARAEKILQKYLEDAKVRHQGQNDDTNVHGPMHQTMASVLEEFKTDNYHKPVLLKPGTRLMIDFCHDDGCYAFAFQDGMINRVRIDLKNAHKLLYAFEQTITILYV